MYKKIKVLALLLTFVAINNFIFAQNSKVFIPLNFQKAVEKGTRSYDGKPGASYFQNSSDYNINVDFDPITGVLTGSEFITYHNNSNDTLKYVVVRLYQNYLKNEALRQTEVDKSDLNNGIEISKIVVGEWLVPNEKIREFGTNIVIPVSFKIKPNSVVEIEIDWKVNLPNKTLIRMGRYDSTSYFVAYWYPQISVYDDLDGWCFENYTGVQEFYNDFCNYDININVPKNYIIWATGELQNSTDFFTNEILKRIDLAKKSDNLIRIITQKDYEENKVLKSDQQTQWHFVAKNVTDFAFGVSDHYLWDGTSVEVDAKTKRRVMANAVYKTPAGEGIAEIVSRTIKLLSTKTIGYPYPYPHNTVWEGHFGMEFPMMCNNGPEDDLFMEVFVTSHEVSHTYFPFIVGTNETQNTWLDEGLITFIPKEIEKDYGNAEPHYYINSYSKYSMGRIYDLPLSVPTTQMSENVLMMQNYGRAATGFYLLNEMLGEEMFKKAILEFVNNWAGKHPTPTDLLYTFNSVANEDLAWFWQPWFYEFGYADLSLENVIIKNNKVKLNVLNKGNFPVPIRITIFFTDKTTEVIYENTRIWKNTNTFSLEKKYTKTIEKIILGDNNIPDAFVNNNIFEIK